MGPVDGARLHRIGDECWVADRELSYGRGTLPLRMVIVRGEAGALTLYSPIDLDPGTREALMGLGHVTRIISPNRFHTLFVDRAMEIYPDARLLVSHADGGLAERFPGRTTLIGEPTGLGTGLETVPVRLREGLSELVLFHDQSETLILADLLFNVQQAASPAVRLACRMNGIWRRPGHSRLQRLLLLRDEESLGAFYRWALSKPFVQIAMAHGQLIAEDAREQFYQVFRRYGR
jgi:hypothetical protein